ncbi:MAG TPA: hypothetical protein VH592_10500 [Gemmataceae bacterium]|jgi:hypothetical protein
MYYSHLDIKDFQENPKPDPFSGRFSDLFLETYPTLFPESYTQEIYDFFRIYTHSYRRCFDTPAASPRNEEIESAILNKGKDGCCTFIRENNIKFIVRLMRVEMYESEKHHRKHYYTSDIRRTMLMFDADCHDAYQTRAMTKEAQRIIKEEMRAVIGAAPCFVGSGRGENGYLKVKIDGFTTDEANEGYDDLQEAIRLLLAKHGCLADFEIKGTITWMDDAGKLHAGRYGKLPMCSPDWSYAWFDDFRRARTVTIKDLKKLIDEIKAKVTDEDERRHDAAVHAAILAHYLPLDKDHEWKLNRDVGNAWQDDTIIHEGRSWVARRVLPDNVIEKLWPNYHPDIDKEATDSQATFHSRSLRSLDAGVPFGDTGLEPLVEGDKIKMPAPKPNLVDEPDSYKRQHAALLVFARSLKRVPSLKEALGYIQQNGLFTGSWQQNEARRKSRVKNILKRIAKSFDPSKCSTRTVDAAKLQAWAAANASKYEAWAKKKFPTGIMGGKKHVGEDGEIYQQTLHVGPQFIGIFIAVCQFGLLVDRNEDDSLPHERAKKTWKALHDKGLVTVPFCDRKWAVCRDVLEGYGIVKVIDRDYCSNKAMKWAVGRFFPGLGLWKRRKVPSLLPPITLAEFALMCGGREQEGLNSLLRQQSAEMGKRSYLHSIRPPPTVLGA